MLTVQEHFKEATTPQVEEFAQHAALSIEDAALFVSNADQTSRRLINSIQRSQVLDTLTPDQMSEKAAEVGISLELKDGKIAVPNDKQNMKMVLRFLEQSVFKGLLTEEVFVSNSKRAVS